MSKADVRRSIAHLRKEILLLDETDGLSRQALNDTVDRLEQRLESDGANQEQLDDNAVLQLVETYEAKYPRITALINDLTTRLMGMGI